MIEIKIDRDNKEILDEMYPMSILNLMGKYGRIIDEKDFPISAREFFEQKGMIMGILERTYEVPNQGMIKYTELLNLNQRYLAVINLEGFNEKEDFVWKMKSNLEKIATAQSLEEIKEFLPEDIFKK